MEKSFRRFLKFFFITFTIGGIFISSQLLFLYNIGELNSYTNIIKDQQKYDLLFGPGIIIDELKYKTELYTQIKPEIIVIGSSRALKFNGEMFKTTFVNMGRAITSLERAPQIFEFLLKLHKPKVILFAVDFWWFQPDHKIVNSDVALNLSHNFSSADLFLPLNWLYSGKLRFKDYFRYLCMIRTSKKPKHYGIQALKGQDGFDKYGAYFHDANLSGLKKSNLSLDSELLEIKNHMGRLFFSASYNRAAVENYKKVIDICKSNNIILVPFLPPVSPKIAEAIIKEKSTFLAELINLLESQYETFNYHKGDTISSKLDEFFDGVHADNVNAAKLLKSLVKVRPCLDRHVNHSIIDKMSSHQKPVHYTYNGLSKEDMRALVENTKQM